MFSFERNLFWRSLSLLAMVLPSSFCLSLLGFEGNKWVAGFPRRFFVVMDCFRIRVDFF